LRIQIGMHIEFPTPIGWTSRSLTPQTGKIEDGKGVGRLGFIICMPTRMPFQSIPHSIMRS
ncbi:MAG: hypothetical protein AB3N18_09485, partial [Allomuricauda sp.]